MKRTVHSVPDVASIRSLRSRANAPVCFLENSDDFFKFSTSSTATDDGTTIVKPSAIAADKPGRWLLQKFTSEDFTIGDGTVTTKKLSPTALFAHVKSDGTGHYATIQAAIDAGQTHILATGQFILDEGLTWPDSDATIYIPGGSKLSFVGAITAFLQPDGLTAHRVHRILGQGEIEGDNTAGQEFWRQADTGGFAEGYVQASKISGFRKVLNQFAGDAEDAIVTRFTFDCPYVLPAQDDSILVSTVSSPGDGVGPFAVTFINGPLPADEGDDANDFAWVLNCDSDLTFHGHCRLALSSSSSCNGLQVDGSLQLGFKAGKSGTFEVMGYAGGDSSLQSQLIVLAGATTLKLTGGLLDVRNVYLTEANTHLVIAGAKCKVHVGSMTAVNGVGVDVLVGADSCEISGNFGDCTTAALRTAAQKTRVQGADFASTGAHKTIVDKDAGDYTLGVGCVGVSSGGGMTLAANSKVTVGTYNLA